MKRKVSVLLATGLLVGLMAVPSYATSEEVVQETQVIYTQYGEIQVDITLEFQDLALYSTTRRAVKTATYHYDGNVIAEVTLDATFGYDGEDVWVEEADTSHTTYRGWSYGSERITESGGVARVTARLTHLLDSPVPVDVSITCTPSGTIS